MTARPRRRRRWLRVTAIVVASALTLVVGGLVALALSVQTAVSTIPTLSSVEVFPAPEARLDPAVVPPGTTNILLLGSDARDPLDDADAVAGSRSDTIMIANVSADGVTIMSVLRDTWVDIPGHGQAKINAAMSLGGLPLAVQTLEQYTGARIDHVALIDFEGFRGLTDALGGVTVQNPTTFTSSHLRGHVFERGRLTLTGEQALAFVRERYAFVDGDYTRARNQQEFLRGVLDGVLSGETLAQPWRISGMIAQLAPYLLVDDGLDAGAMLDIAVRTLGHGASGVRFFSAPTAGTGMVGDQSVVFSDDAGMEAVRAAFANGTLADLADG